jgi:hypothetical protein
MLVGIFFWQIHKVVSPLISAKNAELGVFLIVLLLFCSKPYASFIELNYKRGETPDQYDFYYLTHLIRKAEKGERDLGGYNILKDTYNAQNYFYISKMQDKGFDIDFKHSADIVPGDRVIVDETLGYNFIYNRTEHELLWDENDGKIKAFLINSIKE